MNKPTYDWMRPGGTTSFGLGPVRMERRRTGLGSAYFDYVKLVTNAAVASDAA